MTNPRQSQLKTKNTARAKRPQYPSSRSRERPNPTQSDAGFNPSARALGRFARRPHLFEIVEFPNFRTEDVDDDVARVDQHPVAIGHAFDTRANASFVQILN